MNEVLTKPSFRWYWLGLFLSGLGDQFGWMGLTWFFLKQTNSPAVVGTLVSAYFLPSLVSGLFIGILLDRFDRRKLIIWDNLFRGIIVVLLVSILSFFQSPIWLIILIVGVLGMLSPLSSAGAQTLLPALIGDKEMLTNANGLMQSQWQIVYLFGPALAGLLIGLIGEKAVLLIDALSFFVCAFCFFRLKLPASPVKQGNTKPPLAGELLTGYQFILRNPVFIWLLIITLFFNMAYGPIEVALPFYANEQLAGEASTLGLLWASLALGALVGSGWFSVKAWRFPVGYSLSSIILLWGVTTLPLAIWPGLPVAMFSLFVAGICFSPYNVLYVSYLQRQVPDEMLGRVITSARTITGLGMPLGAFFSGILVHSFGVMQLLLFSALGCILVGLASLRPLRQLK
ncbi:MFS transporter [Brevibacillus sp. SYSU BS000544]|uniref:MFS transporter n=1 Tax=Brevibacillus sp. SYSU BS000544 TaxID=3416443 RepID=UPI003CE59718